MDVGGSLGNRLRWLLPAAAKKKKSPAPAKLGLSFLRCTLTATRGRTAPCGISSSACVVARTGRCRPGEHSGGFFGAGGGTPEAWGQQGAWSAWGTSFRARALLAEAGPWPWLFPDAFLNSEYRTSCFLESCLGLYSVLCRVRFGLLLLRWHGCLRLRVFEADSVSSHCAPAWQV